MQLCGQRNALELISIRFSVNRSVMSRNRALAINMPIMIGCNEHAKCQRDRQHFPLTLQGMAQSVVGGAAAACN